MSRIFFPVIETEPVHKFSIPIKTEEYEDGVDGLSCLLVFTYTAEYPEVEPLIELDNAENIENEDQTNLIEYLQEQAKENLGMVMIFTLVSAGQEWLNVKWDDIKKLREEMALKKIQDDEEAEQKRFDGTRVTVETFMKWKTQFEQDMGIAKKRELEAIGGKKLTGRELFMTDKTLNESDLKFLDEGAAVKVDESLFQDLDDLDLEDEEDDDFDPNDLESESDSS